MRKLLKLLAILLAIALGAAACGVDNSGNASGQEQEIRTQQSNYDLLVTGQPASSMDFSPTRESINKWIETWDEPGKLSYVYMQATNGQLIGYFVLEGLPVSYCAALTPTYDLIKVDLGQYDGKMQVQAPSIDGVYYSGGQCSQYYGWDAVTGGYLEWSIGDGISYLLYELPLARQDVEPLGYAIIGDDGELLNN